MPGGLVLSPNPLSEASLPCTYSSCSNCLYKSFAKTVYGHGHYLSMGVTILNTSVHGEKDMHCLEIKDLFLHLR